ncbi:hypothetical protein BU16DRAFT_621055 [Lophium mytilinum]|uniref:F-box domain-containing protein n=1 Tax=Lophium mytilinum TaxID=390894 RepID=A0A6A6QHG0_9PEZI|nr:hypothetical protein BU16DRAFT_621055 [Lophium mytilinum]
MAVLLDLPSELLLDILSFVRTTLNLSARLQKSTFFALSLTSKRLNTLANPFLYHEYVNLDVRRELSPFANTIIDRPDLAAHVRRLALRGVKRVYNGELDTILRLVDTKDFPRTSTSVSEGRPQEAVAFFLIMTLAPKLEYLHLESMDLIRVSWLILSLVLQKAPREIPGIFGYLKIVDLDCRDSKWNIDIITVSGFLCLPSLETFQLRGAVHSIIDASQWKCPVRSSSVASIILEEGSFSAGVFSKLISSSKALRNFVSVGNTSWCARSPGTYLLEHRSSLETIHWSLSDSHFQADLISNEKGSMRDFQKLHTLIWDQFQLGELSAWRHGTGLRLVDHLPSSLVSLVLKNCNLAIIGHLDDLADADSTWLPNLETVNVQMTMLREGIVQDEIAGYHLRKIAERSALKNVRMEFTLPSSI